MFTTTPSIFLIIVIDITTTPNIDILHKTNKYSLVLILPPKYLVDIQTKYKPNTMCHPFQIILQVIRDITTRPRQFYINYATQITDSSQYANNMLYSVT